MRRLALALLAAALLASGCGHPLIPAADTRPATPKKKPVAAVTPRMQVLGGKPVVGVDLYALDNYPAAVVQADGERMMSYIRTVLKADAVGIVWNLYAPSRTSDEIRAMSKTLSAANVKILTQIAEQDGLEVFYRPLIFVSGDPSDPWEGKIRPANPAQWFDSYYDAELPYLRTAQQMGVSEFVAETEMHAMNASPGWPAFFNRLAGAYHGVISYASWDGDFFPPTGHLQQLPALGMDMYEPIPHLAASAPVSAVLAGWERFLDKMPKSVLARTTIQEMGIEARAGAYQHPPALGAAGTLDERVQANWFTAACEAVRKYDMRGLFFWKVDLTDNPAYPASSLSTFEGKLGAQAIANCSSILG
jgi:glycosyl hydrolase family 113